MPSSRNAAIRVDGIAKQYQIGSAPTSTYRTLRESIGGAFHNGARRLSRLRGRSKTAKVPNETEHRSNDFWALRDVSFDVQPGEVIGIIGRNGAGKSTLLKILSRIAEPTRGRVEIRGRMGSLLEVGTGFHPELTGRENIYLNGAILGMSRREIARKFDEIVDFAEVERFLDTPVKRYSSGMYVRLAFAVASHLEPEILIVDEVLAVGDAQFQRKCLGQMRQAREGGRTVLFVSHNISAVRSLCTRVVMFDHGVLTFDGQTEEGIQRYLHGQVTSETAREIPENQSRESNQLARMLRVAVTTLEEKPVAHLRYGEPFRVEFECDVYQDIQSGHFEVSVCTWDGLNVLYSTTMEGDHSQSLPQGRYRVSAAFEGDLLPKRYAIALGVHRNDGETLDYVPHACDVEVIRVGWGTRPNFPWSSARGHVRTDAAWSFRQIE